VKKPVDYLYLKWNAGKLKRACVNEYQVAGIKVLEVCSVIPKEGRNEKSRCKAGRFEHWRRRLKRILTPYDLSSCVINGDAEVLQALQIKNVGFLARKNELLMHGAYIFEHLAFKKVPRQREKLLIYLESENWKNQEIYDLLWIAKDYYEDIVLAFRNLSGYEDIMAQIYEDCGLVVSVLDFKKAEAGMYDGVLFLIEKWNSRYAEKICFRRAYVTAEYEDSSSTIRKMVRAVTEEPVCFSGLCYEWGSKKIPYPLAVDLFYQNPEFCNKKEISFVAIYRLECYNKYGIDFARSCEGTKQL